MAEPETRPETDQQEVSRPELPADFFRKLLNPPSCKTTGVCDNCGRCEH